jgi:hypothetical protein
MGKPRNTGAGFNIFNFVIYDPDVGEINLGYFATVGLAMMKKREVEETYGHSLDKDEYEFKVIKVTTKMKVKSDGKRKTLKNR